MSTTANEDHVLISLCLEGQELGYAMLYEKYAVSVFNTICRLLNHQLADAEDLLQETFVAVFSDMARVREVDSFEAWIKRVAINRSISHLRKRKVHVQELTEADRVQPVEEEDDAQWREDRLEELELAIQALPELTRTIVHLYLFENLSQEEIGNMLGMSHTAVRSQYHRAKRKIAAQLRSGINEETETR